MRLALVWLALAATALAQQLAQPMVGQSKTYHAQVDDDLLKVAKSHSLAVEHIAFANGFPITAVQIVPGTKLLIPQQRILPANPPRTGLVLNIPERGIFRFKDGKFVEFVPVGVGKGPTAETPIGSFHIIEKIVNPTWYPPAWNGDTTPVGPGPKNPLGERWIGLSAPRVGIHGTNDPLNVGGPVTHGCVRCYPDQVKDLFQHVTVGMPVRIEYETAKLGKDAAGNLYLATFPDLYKRMDPTKRSEALLKKIGKEGLLQQRNFAGKVGLMLGTPIPLK
jgi:L,D-transpeptidase ErfK/SrfK